MTPEAGGVVDYMSGAAIGAGAVDAGVHAPKWRMDDQDESSLGFAMKVLRHAANYYSQHPLESFPGGASSAAAVPGADLEEPDKPVVFVNPKQYKRILVRREQRKKLYKRLKRRQESFLYESRHRHSKNRVRSKDGRFLNKAELKQMRDRENEEKAAAEEKCTLDRKV